MLLQLTKLRPGKKTNKDMFLASYPGAEQYIMLMTYISEMNKKVR